MESIKSIEIVSSTEEENICFNVEDDEVDTIQYEAIPIGIKLIIMKNHVETEIFVPWYNISISSVIKN